MSRGPRTNGVTPLNSMMKGGLTKGQPFTPIQFGPDPLQSFLSFSEIMSFAVAALDDDRHLRGCNRTFSAMLREGDGLRVAGNVVSAAAQDDADKLTASLAAIARARHDDAYLDIAAPAQLFSVRRLGRTTLSCTVVPAASLFSPAPLEATAILFVGDSEICEHDSILGICALYQLTPAETQLALFLVQGYNIADIATAMDLKEETVRAYLKHIYTKTDTSRQPELIQLLLASRLPLILPGPQEVVSNRTRRRH